MRAPDAIELAALELRLFDLAHPDWTGEAGLVTPSLDPTSDEADRRPLALSAALSRWLIDQHRLAMLAPESFSRSWAYAVLGGHRATQSLHEQTVSYLAATWVRRAVAGAHARSLHRALGLAAYEDALHRTRPLDAWRAPRLMPEAPLQWLEAQSRTCLTAPWRREAPSLAAWAAVMSPSTHALDIDIGPTDDRPPPSRALLDELDTRLQEDFAIELDPHEADV